MNTQPSASFSSVAAQAASLNQLVKKKEEMAFPTKSCLFNLIVYTNEPRRTAYFKEMVKMIQGFFPCRVIFITALPEAKESTFAVTSCDEGCDDKGMLKTDEIFITTAGQGIQKVYFLLLTLFVPDLPIYLLWGQDPSKEYTILPHLEHFATRLIFDAEATSDLQQFSKNITQRLKESTTDIMDITWAKINGWREILAQVFDSEERIKQLSLASSIEIFYNSTPSELFVHPETQAAYLQAWLASRLGWKFVSCEKKGASRLLTYQKAGEKHLLQLVPRLNPQFEAEEILSIEVSGGQNYECHIQRLFGEQIRVQASNQFQCELPFVLLMPTLCSGRRLMQEIFYQKMSTQYPLTLRYLSETLWS